MAAGGAEQLRKRLQVKQEELLRQAEAVIMLPLEKISRRPEVRFINRYVLVQTYLVMAVKALGYLALTWSTVVLLGGFVTLLQSKDFLCLTLISLVQAARIFSSGANEQYSYFVRRLFVWLLRRVKTLQHQALLDPWKRGPCFLATALLLAPLPLMMGFYPVLVCYFFIWVSYTRLRLQDYGQSDGDVTKANLRPAMNIFYSLALAQGMLYLLLVLWNLVRQILVKRVVRECEFDSSWGESSVTRYHSDTLFKCLKDQSSTEDRNLVTYAVEQLGSDSAEDYLAGARMLSSFVHKHEVQVQQLIRSSRTKIQKLVATLAWAEPDDREIRKLAARIVAHLAAYVSLAQFPGALQCVASLFEPPPGGDDDDDVLVVLGLKILQRLAHDKHNCGEIIRDRGIVAKITAPMVSAKLIKDMEHSAWAKTVYKSIKVLTRLTGAPGEAGVKLRGELASDKNVISNMLDILESSREARDDPSKNMAVLDTKLKTQVVQILTHLLLDDSTICTARGKGNTQRFVKMVLPIFLSDQGMKHGETQGKDQEIEEAQAIAKVKAELKQKAGEALVVLSLESQTNCDIILGTAEHGGVADRLTEILDAQNRMAYRITAAEMLGNLCFHCKVDHKCAKETILPKALTELCGERETKTRDTTADKTVAPSPAPTNDEENPVQAQIKKFREEDAGSERKMQASLLSLLATIHVNELIGADEFEAVVQQKIAFFIRHLKHMVDSNSNSNWGIATVDGLRIVKATGQMIISMIKNNSQYVQRISDENIVQTLSEAAEKMARLESRMLFVGNHRHGEESKRFAGARPLLCDVVKEANHLLRSWGNTC